MTLNSSGRLWIDDFAFTNIGDKLTGQSVSHATPVKSEPIGEMCIRDSTIDSSSPQSSTFLIILNSSIFLNLILFV